MDFFLEALYFLPTIWFYAEDGFYKSRPSMEGRVQFFMLKALIPLVWAWIILLYRWVWLYEDMTLSMIVQLAAGAFLTWYRWGQSFIIDLNPEYLNPDYQLDETGETRYKELLEGFETYREKNRCRTLTSEDVECVMDLIDDLIALNLKPAQH